MTSPPRPPYTVNRADTEPSAPPGEALPAQPPELPRGTTELVEGAVAPEWDERGERGDHGEPVVRVRARSTPGQAEPTRALIYAPEATRASWIEGELSRAQVTIQVARRVRTVVAALTKDPPPRPELLIVDFDAISAAELLELHSIRDVWAGRLIGLGSVPQALRASLVIDRVLAAPLVRDSLLDCVAGTRHATPTVPIPMFEAIAMFGLNGERSEK